MVHIDLIMEYILHISTVKTLLYWILLEYNCELFRCEWNIVHFYTIGGKGKRGLLSRWIDLKINLPPG